MISKIKEENKEENYVNPPDHPQKKMRNGSKSPVVVKCASHVHGLSGAVLR